MQNIIEENISKKLSCGVLIVDSNDNLLLIHVTGQDFWDIPKGTQEISEQPITTAVRELYEEAGIIVSEDDLIEVGWCEYNRYKDLWLFILPVDYVNTNSLVCHCSFTDRDGNEQPESDDYRMIPLDEADELMCGSLKRLYNNELFRELKRVNETAPRKNFSYSKLEY